MTPHPILAGDSARLAALRLYGIVDTADEAAFDDLRKLAAYLCETPIALVSFVEESRQWFKSEGGLGVRETPLADSICAHALAETRSLVVPDTQADPRFAGYRLCQGSDAIRFYAGAVIRSPDGHALGSMCVLDHRPRELSPGQVSVLEALARQVMQLVELRWQKAEAERIGALRGVIGVCLAGNGLEKDALHGCTEAFVRHLDVAFARIWSLEPDEVLHLRASSGLYTHLDGPHGRVKLGEFKIGRIAESAQPLLTNDVAHDPNIGDPEWAKREGMRAFAGYPLIVASKVVGVLAMFGRNPFSDAVLSELSPLSDAIAQYLERKRAEGELRRREEAARFLNQVSSDLAQLTDPISALQKITSASVPSFADVCMVDLAEGDVPLRRLAVSARDPEIARRCLDLADRYPMEAGGSSLPAQVIRSGVAEVITEVSPALLQGKASDEEHLRLLTELQLRSVLCVPLRSRGRSMGAITFAATDASGRRYSAEEFAVAADVAQRAAVSLENAHLMQALQEADRRKDEFLATLAHELRNPLAPLRNAMALLFDPELEEAARIETQAIMQRQLQQLGRLVDDLLDASRITRGHIELRREIMPLSRALENAAEISQPLIAKAGQSLTMTLPPEPVLLDADPTRLAQIFSNLLNNASKYTPRGGLIWVTASIEGAEVVVQVRDTGVGIEREMLERIFNLFTQEERSLDRSQGGLGIGLTLVRKLVEMHSGKVSAFSEGLGKGSEITVRLPVAAAAGESKAPVAPLTAGATSHRILLVDDNRDAASTLSKLLRRRGHEVALAFDGEEAVATAASFGPAVVLMDIGLPKLDGYEAGRLILAQGHPHPVMLIALTGWGQEEDRRRAREAGFSHHLVKPIELEVLLALLHQTHAQT